jgi:hypothetical protein
MSLSPSPLRSNAWRRALVGYPSDLAALLCGILEYGTTIGYEGEPRQKAYNNLSTAFEDPAVISNKL